MSFSIQGVSRAYAQIGQMKSRLEMGSTSSNGVENLSNRTQSQFGLSDSDSDTYNAKGKLDKSTYNARVISNTFDKLNQGNSSSKFKNAQAESYQFNKDVLGAYTGLLR